MFDIKKVKEEAAKQLADEKAEKAKKALVAKMRARDAAADVLRNIDREITDLEASIADGSFVA
jgi:hypothetical protein